MAHRVSLRIHLTLAGGQDPWPHLRCRRPTNPLEAGCHLRCISRNRIQNGKDMPPTPSAREAYRVPLRSFIPFLLISFGLAWGILGLYIFLPERMGTVFGKLTGNHPLFFMAVYAPAVAAFILVARSGGVAGLRRFLGRALDRKSVV